MVEGSLTNSGADRLATHLAVSHTENRLERRQTESKQRSKVGCPPSLWSRRPAPELVGWLPEFLN